jgi:invasion protein IalB
MTSFKFLRSAACAAALIFAGSSALAQDQGGQQAPRKPITPTTMKTFGGWDVRCYPVQAPAPCDMWEAIAFKKGGQLAVSVSIAYAPSSDQHGVQLIVPLGIDLAQGAKVLTDGYTSATYPFHHCDRIGCYIMVQDGGTQIVDALKGHGAMKVHVVQFHGKPVDLNVPLKGFDEAHAAMVELNKQKSGKQPAAAQATDAANP